MSNKNFTLHSQLAHDCIVLGHFELSLVLLMNDKQYPWFILVPQRDGIKEIHELSDQDQQQLVVESSVFAKTILTLFQADKLNIAALGNMVPQLHLHHIVRYQTDSAWPGPVWGVSSAQAYTDIEIKQIINELKSSAIAGLEFAS